MNNYKDFDVYQRAYKLAIQIHQLSYSLPKELQFDLADQVRRASRSIPSNIAEGYGRRKSTKDIQNFLTTTLGSNDEMLFNLEFMKDVQLITAKTYQQLSEEYVICGKQLFKLIQSF